MLVLSRNVGEKIVLPYLGITICFVSHRSNGGIRIGIESPEEHVVFREETWEQVKLGDPERAEIIMNGGPRK